MAGEPSVSRTGETLEARYRLGRYLGDDGPAEVYAATDTREGSAVVVRLLRPELALQRGAVEGFVALPKALLSASPPHVARVLAVTSDDTGIPFVVEESSVGETLADRLAMQPAGLPLAEAARVVAPVIEAVARMHLAGVVHGRLEPSRIVLVPFADRSISRIVHHCAAPSEVRVRAAYQAPEQRAGVLPDEPAVDVWALGTLLHHVLTGRVPSTEPSRADLDQALPDVGAAIVSALHDCLRAESSQRLLDAAVLWMRVEGALAQAAKVMPAPMLEHVIEADEPQSEIDVAPVADMPAPMPAAALAHAFAPLEEDAPKASEVSAPKPVAPPAAKKPPPRATSAVGPHAGGVALAEREPPSKNFPMAATQRARAAGALTSSQLNSLLALDREQEHRAWPWIRIALLLLLLLLLYKAVPFLTEPDLVAARRVFGPQLRIAGIALMVVTVAALARTWAISTKGNALLLRPTVYSFQVVALCICVLVGGSLWFGFGDVSGYGGGVGGRAGGAGWRAIGGFARMGLAYGATLMMSFGALYGLMQALRSMRDATALAIATLMLALGGGAASLSLAVTTIKPELQKTIERAQGKPTEDDGAPNIERIKQAFKPKQIDLQRTAEPSNTNTGPEPELRERTSIGGGDDETLIMEDMKRQRAHQQNVIRAAEKELPTTVPR